ncbi:MAG: hypothetical protein RL172_1803 [Bacteroidota bacterium]|jgi:hypothetical protein
MENIKVYPEVYKHRLNEAGECSIIIIVLHNRSIIVRDKLNKKIP